MYTIAHSPWGREREEPQAAACTGQMCSPIIGSPDTTCVSGYILSTHAVSGSCTQSGSQGGPQYDSWIEAGKPGPAASFTPF